MVVDRAMDGDTFLAQMLSPTLEPGDILVMSNLPAQGRECARSDRGGRARLPYLRPYSPDLNPVEAAFAQRRSPGEGTPLPSG